MAKIYCPKCKRTLEDTAFYTYKDGSKCKQCKKCQTMHIDNYNPETFKWLLKEMDVPYIPHEWNVLRDRAAQKAAADGKPMTGMSVYGKYLSKMKLNQWKDYTWEDTEKIAANALAEAEAIKQEGSPLGELITSDEEALREMLENGEINEAQYKTLSSEDIPQFAPPGAYSNYPNNSPYEQVDIVDVGADLTMEDKQYLAMKWGKLYRADQWVALEQLWSAMHDSFDIQGAAREDTVKKICKTSLKMDEAIDENDYDTYQKLSRVYDSLMKAGKFTEAQNKEDGKGFVNSVGELVAICEKEGGFIPRLDIEFPQDIVDKTLQDMNRYTYNLVTKDLGLAQQIEDQLKKMAIQREIEEEEDNLAQNDPFEDVERTVLDDIAHEEFYNLVENERSLDDEASGGDGNVA